MEQERPTGMGSRCVPVVKHSQQLKKDLNGEHPSDDRPDKHEQHPDETPYSGDQSARLGFDNAALLYPISAWCPLEAIALGKFDNGRHALSPHVQKRQFPHRSPDLLAN